MDMVLQGIPGGACYTDNIHVSTKNENQHLQTLEAVFRKLEEHRFLLKQEMCAFLTPSVKYFVHLTDQEGIHPLLPKQSGSNCP